MRARRKEAAAKASKLLPEIGKALQALQAEQKKGKGIEALSNLRQVRLIHYYAKEAGVAVATDLPTKLAKDGSQQVGAPPAALRMHVHAPTHLAPLMLTFPRARSPPRLCSVTAGDCQP